MEEARHALERRLQYLEADPRNLALLAECADLSLRVGRASEARSLLERGLSIAPEDAHLKARLASASIAAGDVPGAIELLTALIDGGESAPELRYNLAYALMLAGRFAEARPILEKLRELPAATVLLVRALHHLGELKEAIRLAEDYAAAHPEDAEIGGQLAQLYLDAGEIDKARAWTDKTLAAKQRIPEVYVTAGYLALGDENEEQAERMLSQALELEPKNGRAWAGRGLTAMFRGDLPAAEESLQRAAAVMPHIGTWLALGWCQLVQGKLDEAEVSFKSAYALDRTFGETHGALAVLDILRGAGGRGRKRSETALRLNPGSVSAQYAELLLSQPSNEGRMQGLRKILAAQRTLRGGSLLDLVARRAGRGRKI